MWKAYPFGISFCQYNADLSNYVLFFKVHILPFVGFFLYDEINSCTSVDINFVGWACIKFITHGLCLISSLWQALSWWDLVWNVLSKLELYRMSLHEWIRLCNNLKYPYFKKMGSGFSRIVCLVWSPSKFK